MNLHGLIAAIGRAYRREATARLRIVDGPLLVTRRDCARGRRDPDLQKMNRVGFRMIEFAVRDSRPGAHSLRFARTYDRAGANAVLVFERAFENVGDDLHVAMPMGRETRAGADAILVDYAQRAKSHLAGIVVVAKRESVAAVEPVDLCASAVGGPARSYHRGRDLRPRRPPGSSSCGSACARFHPRSSSAAARRGPRVRRDPGASPAG